MTKQDYPIPEKTELEERIMLVIEGGQLVQKVYEVYPKNIQIYDKLKEDYDKLKKGESTRGEK